MVCPNLGAKVDVSDQLIGQRGRCRVPFPQQTYCCKTMGREECVHVHLGGGVISESLTIASEREYEDKSGIFLKDLSFDSQH